MGGPKAWLLVALTLLLCAPVASAQIRASAFYQRYEAITPEHRWANLTWDGSKGGLSWDPSPGSRDDRPAADGDTFVSDPTPFDLYLNVSRHIQLELALKDPPGYGNACNTVSSDPQITVTLSVDGQRLASGVPGHNIYWFYISPTRSAPPDPPGYSICRFRMPAELDVVPRGSVVTLTVTWRSTQHAWAYGLAGDHRSVLYLPYFTYEEAVFRLPELKAAEEERFAQSQAGGPSHAAALLVPLPLAPLVARPRRAPVLLALVLVAATLGGCIGSRPSSEDEETEERLTGRVDHVIIADPALEGGAGTIVGQVHDDLHLAIGGVHVSVLGEAAFTTSDAKGRFVLRDLAAGVHKLRFDRKEYRSFESDVEVRSGALSRLDITLFPLDAKGRDFRPHTHDYWPEGITRKEVLNQPLAEECTMSGGCVHNPDFFLTPKDGDTNTILPGTRIVELRLNWDPAKLPFRELGIAVATGLDRFYVAWQNYTLLAPRGPGEPFFLRTSWEATDAGHQPYSAWTFRVFAPYGQGEDFTSAYGLEVSLQASSPVTVSAAIHKGSLPLERAHKDHWGSNDKLEVSKSAFIRNVWYGQPPPPYPGLWSDANYRGVFLTPQKIVPPGTKRVEVVLTTSRDHAPLYGWDLFYKPGDVAPGAADSGTGVGYQTAQKDPGSTGTSMKWVLTIKETESDFEYATKSNWILNFRPDNMMMGWADTGVDFYGPGMRTQFSLTIMAHRT